MALKIPGELKGIPVTAGQGNVLSDQGFDPLYPGSVHQNGKIGNISALIVHRRSKDAEQAHSHLGVAQSQQITEQVL